MLCVVTTLQTHCIDSRFFSLKILYASPHPLSSPSLVALQQRRENKVLLTYHPV